MSSPRLSSESTSTIGSLPSSKGESTARRRLREFYKLQAAGAASTPPPPEISVTKATEDNDEEDEYADGENSILDNEDTNIENWVGDMVKQNDLKSLLKSENRLVRQLGELESSQKALVYNNYNKLISASSTLEAMRETRSANAVDFERLKKSLQTIAQTSSTTTSSLRTKEQDSQVREKLHEKQAARWVLGVERSMTHLKQTGKRNEAIAMGQKAVKLIEKWLENVPDGDHEIKELALIRERCQGMLAVL